MDSSSPKLLFIIGVFLVGCLGAKVEAADENSRSYSFITQPQHVRVHEGEDVTFRCELEGTGIGLVTWMNDSTLLSYGRMMAYEAPRLSISGEGNAYNLEIKEVTLMDEGEWNCQVPSTSPYTQTNSIFIVIDPTVTATPEEGKLEVMEGEAVRLSCEADGKPEPNVTWTKEGDSEFHEDGDELSFGSIKRDNSGTYTCVASNGVGSGDSETFDVDVMFPPTVEVEEDVIHTGPSDEVQLTCIFTSSPEVNIIWQHNGEDINVSDGSNFEVTTIDGNDYEVTSTLKVKELQQANLGTYTCHGANGKGDDAVGTIQLKGEPYEVEVISDVDGEYSDVFVLEWEFFSVADPTECDLTITQDGQEMGHNTVPSVIGSDSRHHQVFRIEGLTVNTEYGAKLNCKNQFGETGFTEEFHFSTSEEENPAPLPTTTPEPTTTEAPETTKAPTQVLPESTHVAITNEADLTMVLVTEAPRDIEPIETTSIDSTIGTSAVEGSGDIDQEHEATHIPTTTDDDVDEDDEDKNDIEEKDDHDEEDEKEDFEEIELPEAGETRVGDSATNVRSFGVFTVAIIALVSFHAFR